MKNIAVPYILAAALALTACGGGGAASTPVASPTSPTPGGSTPASSSRFQSVLIVVFENQDYAAVINNPAMPYLNSLARQYGLATQYFANTHPSIGNYFMMTTGQIVSNDDAFAGTVSADNVVRVLTGAGKRWKAYAQSLPSAGYVGGDAYPYIKHHNPFAYFSDVVNDGAQRANIVPLSQLSADVAAGALPHYGFVVPDNQHNSHDCPAGLATCTNNDKLAAADQWLQSTVQPLLASAGFMNSGVLVIAFDESATDNSNGGGRIAAIVVSAKSRPGFASSSFYQHQNLLSLSLRQIGVQSAPGAAAGANPMDEFFQ